MDLTWLCAYEPGVGALFAPLLSCDFRLRMCLIRNEGMSGAEGKPKKTPKHPTPPSPPAKSVIAGLCY